MANARAVSILIAIMATVALIVAGVALTVLYDTAFDQKVADLVQTARSEARLIESVARFDRVYSNDYPEGATAATLSQIKDAHARFRGFGETGEFTLARRVGNEIRFVLRHRHHDLDKPKPVPLRSRLAEPMRRALLGQSGAMVGLDYRGVTVVAAYEPVAVLDLGIVAKIDLAEVRAPFLRAGGIVAVIAISIIAAGTVLFFHVANPMVERLRESEARYRSMTQSSRIAAIIAQDDEGRVVSWNPAAERIFGYSESEILGTPLSRLIPECHMEAHRKAVRRAGKTGVVRQAGKLLKFVGLRKDGSEFPLEMSLGAWNVGDRIYFGAVLHDITERERADRALRKRTRELAHKSRVLDIVLQNVDHGITMIDANLRMVAFNQKFFEMLEFPSSLAEPGRTFEDFIRYNAKRGEYGPGDVETQVRDRVELAKRFESHKIERTRPDGRTIEISGNPTAAGGFVTTYRDITERKAAETALSQSEARFRDLVEGSIQGISILQDYRAVFANQSYADIFGYASADEIVALGEVLPLIAPHDRERLVDFNKMRLAGEPAPDQYEYQGVRKDGSVIWLDNRIRVIEWRGRPAVQVTIVDITQRKRTEEELRQRQKMDALGTLAAGIAHDLNNTLVPILGLTQLSLMRLPADHPSRANHEMVLTAGHRAKALVDKILTFGRVERGENRSVPITQAVRDALKLLAATLPKSVKIKQKFIEGSESELISPTDIYEIVMNLGSNAADAMDDKGVLSVSLDLVDIDGPSAAKIHGLGAGRYCKLKFEDTGTGIDEATKKRIFDPFFTTKPVGEGTGMGLSIVHSLVAGLDGAIDVSSVPNRGTTFDLYFPVRSDPAAAREKKFRTVEREIHGGQRQQNRA